MDPNGLQTILTATPGQLQMLERKLTPGQSYPFNLNAGSLFTPSSVTAYLRPAEDGYELRLEQPIQYGGRDPELQQLAVQGWHSAATLDELAIFIRHHFGRARSTNNGHAVRDSARGTSGSAPAVRRTAVLPSAAQVTDLAEARRQLAERPAAQRLFVDRDRMAGHLQRHIHGQEAVLNVLVDQIALEFGKSERRKPLSFYFSGPSGVGKTETALTLAEALDFSEHNVRYTLVRHNMHEYQERHSAYRFVGAPPSYVGYGDPPRLFQEIERNPHLVILLDEIEKAHPDILKTLMALIDTGELAFPTTGGGTQVGDFRRCVLIFTSNVRLPGLQSNRSDHVDQASMEFQLRARQELVRQQMPAEIAGRIQTVLRFDDLSTEHLLAIVADKIQRCAADYGLTISRIAPVLLTELAQQATSSSFGVRMVEQVVERRVAPRLLELLRTDARVRNVEINSVDGSVVARPASAGRVLPPVA